MRRRRVKRTMIGDQALLTKKLELAACYFLKFQQNDIVPNCYWGIPGLHYETDLICLRKSGWAIEIEIKATAADIKADLKKRHKHDSHLFKELWFCVPEELAEDPNIPERAGILAVHFSHKDKWLGSVYVTRRAKRNPHAIKWTPVLKEKLLRLGNMRTWSLKTSYVKRNILRNNEARRTKCG